MIAPTPDTVDDDCRQIVRLAESVRKLYRENYESGYTTPKYGGGAERGGLQLAADGTPGGLGGVVGSRGRIRSFLERAGRSTSRAKDLLKGAQEAMNELIAALDQEHPQTLPVDATFPRTVTSSELKRIRKTKMKRRTAVAEGKGAFPWTGDREMP